MSASRELADLVSESPSTDLNLDNNTLFVDVSENRVGIGTTAPASSLVVVDTSASAASVVFTKDSALTSITGNVAADAFAHALSLQNTNTSTDTNIASIGFGVNTSNAQSNAVIAGQSISSGNMALTFHTEASNSINERMRITEAGNVGIGTTDPNDRLTSATSKDSTALAIVNLTQTTLGTEKNYISFYGTNNSGNLITTPLAQIGAQSNNGSYQQGDLIFYTSPFNSSSAERMRITSTGNVGIGTTAPSPGLGGSDVTLEIAGATSPSLTINDTGQTEKYSLYADSNDFKIAYGSTILTTFQNDGKVGIGTTAPDTLLEIRGSDAHFKIDDTDSGAQLTLRGNVSSDTVMGLISFYNNTDNDTLAAIRVNREGANDAANITFYTQATSSNNTERMRITSTGNVGIGTTAPSDILHIKKQVGGAYSGGVISGGLRIDSGLSGTDGAYAHNGITFYGDANNASFIYQIHNSNGSSQLAIGTNNNERIRIDANGRIITLTNPLIIGSTSVNSSYAAGGGTITNALLLERTTSAPDSTEVGNAANNTQAYLYCQQDGGVAKVFVMDSNGIRTQISTHTNDDEKDYEIFDSSPINGQIRHRRINVIKLTRALEKLTGEKFLREWYD